MVEIACNTVRGSTNIGQTWTDELECRNGRVVADLLQEDL